MVGREYEHGGIAKDGAKLVTAVACAQVPKLTVSSAARSAPATTAMCGRAYAPRQLCMWPNARISVMGARQAAETLLTCGSTRCGPAARTSRRTRGLQPPILDKYEEEGSPYHSTARLWDDGILDPLDTRRVLALGLAAATRAPVPEPRFGVFRM